MFLISYVHVHHLLLDKGSSPLATQEKVAVNTGQNGYCLMLKSSVFAHHHTKLRGGTTLTMNMALISVHAFSTVMPKEVTPYYDLKLSYYRLTWYNPHALSIEYM